MELGANPTQQQHFDNKPIKTRNPRLPIFMSDITEKQAQSVL